MPTPPLPHAFLNHQQLRAIGFLVLVFLLSLSIVTGTTLATTLFLSQAGAASLPLFFIIFALVSTPVSALVSWWLDRTARLFILAALWALLGGIACLGWLFGINNATAAFVFYLGISTTELLLGSLAGILLSDYFSLTQSKRLTGKVSLVLALGGISGALLVSLTALWLSPAESLWLIGLLSLLGLLVVAVYHHWQQPLQTSRSDEEDEPAANLQTAGRFKNLGVLLQIYRQQPLARWLTLGVALAVLLQCLQEILAFTLYENHYADEQSLAVFLGFAVGILHLSSLLLAMLVTGFMLPRLGVSKTHLVHPFLNLAAFVTVAASGRLWSGVVAHIASDPLDSSVNTPTTTLLYNALPASVIGRLRLFNDGMVYPLALGFAGVLLLLLEPLMSLLQLAVLGFLLSCLLLLVHWQAGRCYEQRLRHQVSQGTLQFANQAAEQHLPRSPGLHSFTASPLTNIRPERTKAVPVAVFELKRGRMNRWLTLLHQPSMAQEVLQQIQQLDEKNLRRALMYMLPKLTHHPIDSIVLFLRALPVMNDRTRVLLINWYRKHWGNPLLKLAADFPLTAKIHEPLKRRLIWLVTHNFRTRAQSILMELLRPLDQQGTMQGIEIRLYAGDARQQAQALESLSLIPERRFTYWLPLAFEPLPQFSLKLMFLSGHKAESLLMNVFRFMPDPWMQKMAELWPRLASQQTNFSYLGASMMERLELLHRIPLFSELSLDDLQSLDAQLRSRKASAGECLFQQGEAGDCLYIMVSGKVSISRDQQGTNQVLAVLDAGQPVGEMALLDDQPRSATATLLEDAELLRLDKLRFHSLVMQRPQILLGMCKVLAARLRNGC
ncbi:cyclic nucleotide-binding domain-containing protein [Marinospirillum alkaliphilum]|uniref:Cyclic nucleotide-binding domain-containing protein n=1 Tax=Marinospirillum alkaliphilum DSM 21637 TaxID=1122209 RepID=A0A1K1WQV3_9GAMM|nr:cyclic nucleotide-binding domain-containing protein [Marinospirillum alkaliphilum]SFX39777.1 Cyclic nucleotide-binding domain-containing protein [Marinospirillum alkaliphilum DSM 21637]